MREILYRGKTETGRWIYGLPILLHKKSPEGDIVCTDWGIQTFSGSYKVFPESIGQFTGVLDIHRKRVFEHDLVSFQWQVKAGEEQAVVMQIVFLDGEFLMQPAEEYDFEVWPIRVSGSSMEIISNA